MPQTLYSRQQRDILQLFRRRAVYSRDEMAIAGLKYYPNRAVLFGALTRLAVAGYIEIRRMRSTWRKRGIALEFRLTLNGLDYLANDDGDDDAAPLMTPAELKPRKRRKLQPVLVQRGTPQRCGVVMSVCYYAGCYMRDICDVYKGTL